MVCGKKPHQKCAATTTFEWQATGVSLCICKCKETIACHKKISKVRKHVTLVNRNDSIDYERKCDI